MTMETTNGTLQIFPTEGLHAAGHTHDGLPAGQVGDLSAGKNLELLGKAAYNWGTPACPEITSSGKIVLGK